MFWESSRPANQALGSPVWEIGRFLLLLSACDILEAQTNASFTTECPHHSTVLLNWKGEFQLSPWGVRTQRTPLVETSPTTAIDRPGEFRVDGYHNKSHKSAKRVLSEIFKMSEFGFNFVISLKSCRTSGPSKQIFKTEILKTRKAKAKFQLWTSVLTTF